MTKPTMTDNAADIPMTLYAAADILGVPLEWCSADADGKPCATPADPAKAHRTVVRGSARYSVNYGPFNAIHTIRVVSSLVTEDRRGLALLLRGPGNVALLYLGEVGGEKRVYLLDAAKLALPKDGDLFAPCAGLVECIDAVLDAAVAAFVPGKSKDPAWKPAPHLLGVDAVEAEPEPEAA